MCLQHWLNHEKPIGKQISSQDINLRFLVKFYTPDPELLEEELTRFADDASGEVFLYCPHGYWHGFHVITDVV